MIDEQIPFVADTVAGVFVWVMELIIVTAGSSTAWTVGVALLIVLGVFIHSYFTQPTSLSPSIQTGVTSIFTDDITESISQIDISKAELSYDPSGEIQGWISSPTEISFRRRKPHDGSVPHGEIVINYTVKEWG